MHWIYYAGNQIKTETAILDFFLFKKKKAKYDLNLPLTLRDRMLHFQKFPVEFNFT